MEFTVPKIICLAASTLNIKGLVDLLEHYDAEGWTTDTDSDGEALIEVAGKMCYRSFNTETNPNLSKVRDNDNKGYIGNILKSKHGSVLEHVHVTYAMLDVSRVFTHEMVRHRMCNFSQESLRFVRLTDLKAWYPDSFRHALNDDNQSEALAHTFAATIETLEHVQKGLAKDLGLDDEKNPKTFAEKKKLTSAMRRLAPIGLATNIIVTSNLRNWRHMIEMRTSVHAEEEIRLVFANIAEDLRERYPAVFQDMYSDQATDDIPEYRFRHSHV